MCLSNDRVQSKADKVRCVVGRYNDRNQRSWLFIGHGWVVSLLRGRFAIRGCSSFAACKASLSGDRVGPLRATADVLGLGCSNLRVPSSHGPGHSRPQFFELDAAAPTGGASGFVFVPRCVRGGGRRRVGGDRSLMSLRCGCVLVPYIIHELVLDDQRRSIDDGSSQSFDFVLRKRNPLPLERSDGVFVEVASFPSPVPGVGGNRETFVQLGPPWPAPN